MSTLASGPVPTPGPDLVAEMLEGVTIIGTDWRYRYVNPAAARQAGLAPERMVGASLPELFPGVESTDIFARWDACMATGQPQRFEASYGLGGAKVAWYEFSVRRVDEGIFVLSMDITARRATAQGDQARHEAEAKLAAAMAAIPGLAWTLDRDLRFTSSRGSALPLLGLAPDEVVGISLAEYAGSDDPAHPWIRAHRAALAGTPTAFDAEMAGRSWACRAEPLPGPDGSIAGVIGVALDVTDRRAAEAEAARAWATASAALDATSDSVIVHRILRDDADRLEDAEVVFLNTTALRRWFPGRRAEDVRGRRLFEERPELRPILFERYRRAAECREAVRETLWLDSGDGSRAIEVGIQPFAGGLVHVGRDVTEEHAATERLRRSEDRLRRTLDAIHAIVSYREPGADRPMLSAQVTTMLGYRPEDIARDEAWDALVHPADVERARAAWRSPADRWDIEYRMRHADGRWIWVADSGARVRDEHGMMAHAVITDISAERLAAERFRAVFEDNPETIILLRPVRDADGAFLDAEVVAANRVARAERFGGAVEVGGLRLFDRHAGAGAGHPLFEGLREACDGGRAWRSEVAVEDAGVPAWLDVAVFPYEFGFALVARDVTARRRAEVALRESEARYRAMTDSAADAILTIDASGTIVDANPSSRRVFGEPRGGLVGSPITRLMPEGVWAGPRDASGRPGAGDSEGLSRAHAEVVARRVDGSELIAEVSVAAWERAGERFVTAFVRDVTDRRRAERAAELATERVRRLVNADLFGACVAEPGGRVLEANDYWLSLTGWTRDEVTRGEADWRTVTAPESLAADEVAIREIRARGRSAPYEKVYLRRDGARTPVLVVRTEMPGDVDQIASIVLDLTAMKEVSDRAERLAAAIEQTTEAVVITDPGGTITYVNPAFEQVSGYTAAEAVGANPRLISSGEHPATFYTELWATLLRGETWRGELVNRRRDGSRYTELSTISPIRDARGDTVAYVAVKRDVTVERQAEAERRQGQRLDALGQLAGGVAHDFNNLLAAIRGYAEFVREDLPQVSQARSDMDELLRAADRAAALARRLLVFTRRQAVAAARIDPVASIGEAVGMLRRLLGEHVDLRTDLPRGQGQVLADPGQLEQAIVNLALNARDAMPDGGLLEIRAARVDDESVGRRPVIRITVSDSGCGMDTATVARIYEPFFTTKEPGRGTGLGLAMVYAFVQASGGSIRVASSPGQGTSFTIDLPCVEMSSEPAVGAPDADSRGGTESVLVVEDDEATRDVTSRYLRALGYGVRTAATPADALIMLARGPRPDLLLTDVRLPGMQGPRLARAARDIHPGMRVAFMSGFADAFDSGDAGIDTASVLEKPFSRDTLARAVRLALDGH